MLHTWDWIIGARSGGRTGAQTNTYSCFHSAHVVWKIYIRKLCLCLLQWRNIGTFGNLILVRFSVGKLMLWFTPVLIWQICALFILICNNRKHTDYCSKTFGLALIADVEYLFQVQLHSKGNFGTQRFLCQLSKIDPNNLTKNIKACHVQPIQPAGQFIFFTFPKGDTHEVLVKWCTARLTECKIAPVFNVTNLSARLTEVWLTLFNETTITSGNRQASQTWKILIYYILSQSFMLISIFMNQSLFHSVVEH